MRDMLELGSGTDSGTITLVYWESKDRAPYYTLVVDNINLQWIWENLLKKPIWILNILEL